MRSQKTSISVLSEARVNECSPTAIMRASWPCSRTFSLHSETMRLRPVLPINMQLLCMSELGSLPILLPIRRDFDASSASREYCDYLTQSSSRLHSKMLLLLVCPGLVNMLGNLTEGDIRRAISESKKGRILKEATSMNVSSSFSVSGRECPAIA